MSAPSFLPHQLTENCKLLQKVAIIRQPNGHSEVLLLQRSADAQSRPNCWDLPGGNSVWPQQLTQSAADLHYQDVLRELAEETTLQLTSAQLSFKDLVYLSTYFDYAQQIYSIITGWQVDYASCAGGEIVLSAEHQQYVWIGEAELGNYDFGGQKGQFIVDIITQALRRYSQKSQNQNET